MMSAWSMFIEKIRAILSTDPDSCRCLVCAFNWQEELDSDEINEELY